MARFDIGSFAASLNETVSKLDTYRTIFMASRKCSILTPLPAPRLSIRE